MGTASYTPLDPVVQARGESESPGGRRRIQLAWRRRADRESAGEGPVELRPLGQTGLSVSVLGLGAGRIGEPATSDADVDRLVGGALEAGVTLIDTARSYGLSEERLGRALAGRRERVVLSTEGGCGASG